MNTTKQLWVLGHRVTIVETIGDYSLLEVSATANVPGPPPHYHNDACELFHIISGTLDIYLDGRWQTLQKGESLIVPKNCVHTFKNNTQKESRFITTWSPRGFEGFFLDFGVPLEDENAFEQSISEATIERVQNGCAQYGMILTPVD
ncbi:cupin domain-containing protein [Desulfosarcina sp.]|uniref:cupin domain-containing protein n=1 Tax=Desulfosarcina sp. TaxID=2027861 RepID=UPI00356A17D2